MSHQGSSETPIELTNLTKRFGSQVAVDDVTLQIPRGTAFGFIGQNGAGKTTTIKMIMGLLRRDRGGIKVQGMDPEIENGLRVKQNVGYVPEAQYIHHWMRVREVIFFCRSFYPTWDDQLCTDTLALFGLEGDKRVKHLSKGMLVKLALVLAVAHEPDILILDEPMAGLDPIAREEVLDGVLRTVCDGRRTLFFSSHTLTDVQRLADTIGIIHDGRLLVHGSLDTLIGSTKRIRAVLKKENDTLVQPESLVCQRVNRREWLLTVKDFTRDTVERLRAQNHLDHIEVIDVGLEDIFKDYVRGWRASA